MICCVCICSFACSCILLHIENVDKEYVVEAEDPDVEYLEEQQQFVESDPVEEQDLQANFANTDMQQGKPRFIDPMSYKFKFMQLLKYFTCAFKLVGVV